MSYGFLSTNENGEVLISSDTKNLHFAGKILGVNATVTGGLPKHGGFVEFSYAITLAGSAIPVPFFTMPRTQERYGIAGVSSVASGSNKVWTIKIIRTGWHPQASQTNGHNYAPDVFVFVDPTALTATGSHGMQVFSSDGTVSFDSRLTPLSIIGAAVVTPPTNALDSSSISTMSAIECGDMTSQSNFTPVTNGSETFIGNAGDGLGAGRRIYHYSSMAQRQHQVAFTYQAQSCTGLDLYGWCLGYATSANDVSTYWAFYRAGIGELGYWPEANPVGWRLSSGWIPCAAGCHWTSLTDADFFGIDVGGGSSAGGAWPYTNEAINLGSGTVLIADGRNYE